jgi:hypothetical protein
VEIILHQAFFGKKPDISHLEEFRIKCWVLVPDECHTKLEPKAKEHIFVGISKNSKSWLYYNTQSRQIQMSRNITFDSMDHKLYPLPNEEYEDLLSFLLKGEHMSHE